MRCLSTHLCVDVGTRRALGVHHVKLTCFERELQLYWRFTNSMTQIIGAHRLRMACWLSWGDDSRTRLCRHRQCITRSCHAKAVLSRPSALSSTVLDLCASSKAGPKPSFLFLAFKFCTDDCRHRKHPESNVTEFVTDGVE